MKRFNIKALVAIFGISALAGVTGCTDVQRAHWGALGSEGRVTCYSGDKLIFDDFSTGKIQNAAEGADGYEFNSETTGRLMQASGNCVVDYGAKQPAGWTATLPGVTAPLDASAVDVLTKDYRA